MCPAMTRSGTTVQRVDRVDARTSDPATAPGLRPGLREDKAAEADSLRVPKGLIVTQPKPLASGGAGKPVQ
jgi:hypothetical protein